MSEARFGQLPVLLIDDDIQALENTRNLLLTAGFCNVFMLSDSRMALSFLEQHAMAAIVLDLMMPHLDGAELLKQLYRDHPHIPVIVETAADDVRIAVECIKSGAFDYLVKPVRMVSLVSTLKKALESWSLRQADAAREQGFPNGGLNCPEAFAEIRTASSKMFSVFKYVEKVAGSMLPVMITGESGTGKELLARAIHRLSAVPGEMVTVNVAGLDDTMFSDTLFGHRKGAFTGADQIREGLVCRAAGGTLFLDEIGDLNEQSQVKLLRLLQEREYYPAGSDVVRTSSARILLATNVELESMIKEGKFRRDLYFRLCTHLIHIPPLRERREDIPLLLEGFIEAAARHFNKPLPPVAPDLADALAKHPFHGNVRELRSMVFDAVARCPGGSLKTGSFPALVRQGASGQNAALQVSANGFDAIYSLFGRLPTFREIEDFLINEALKVSGSNHALAAALLGVTRQTIGNRLKSQPQKNTSGKYKRTPGPV